MPELSAGLLIFRFESDEPEVLLGRLGGPFWARREHWTVPKGLVEEGEEPFAAALREFEEETGWPPPPGEAIPLGEIRQRGGKRVVAWALEGWFDPKTMRPGVFEMEWPPHSGQTREFPELAEVRWFRADDALDKINQAQVPLVTALIEALVGV